MSRLLILMLCLTLSGCQLTTLGLNRPSTEVQSAQLQPLYQDLMPLLGTYYALGTTTFEPVSPEALVQPCQEQPRPGASTAARTAARIAPSVDASAELTALSAALRHSGAACCTQPQSCAQLEPTAITTSIMRPREGDYLLVEVKTSELTLQRLYDATALTPLSAISVQATRAPLYDLSVITAASAAGSSAGNTAGSRPNLALSADTAAPTTTKVTAPKAPAPKAQSATKAAPQATRKARKPSPPRPKPQYEPAPTQKPLEILLARPLMTAQAQTEAPHAASSSALAPAAPRAVPTVAPSAASRGASAPAQPGALKQELSARGTQLGLTTARALAEDKSSLERLSAGVINLQRLIPQGTLGSGQLNSALNTTLGTLSPGLAPRFNTISNAVSSAHSSLEHSSNNAHLSSSLAALGSLSRTASHVAAALEPNAPPSSAPIAPNPSPAPNPSRAAQSANAGGILATGPLPVAAETED